MSTTKTLGVVLARGGSKGIPGKNIKEIHGKPLICYTIEAALKSKIFTNFVVSTESEKIAEISKSYGAEAPFTRPAALAEDHVWSRDALKHAVLECERVYGITYDYVFELPCVAPLRNEKHIKDVYMKITSEECDSVTSFVLVREAHPVRMKRITGDNITDFCEEYPGGEGSRRQDLEPCYVRNGAIFAMTRKCIVEDFSRHGKICKPYIMGEAESINIDTILDFKLAELLLKERS
jgi:CMP-N-acetylneuraminic acid synthetase